MLSQVYPPYSYTLLISCNSQSSFLRILFGFINSSNGHIILKPCLGPKSKGTQGSRVETQITMITNTFLAMMSMFGIIAQCLPGLPDEIREIKRQTSNRLVFAHFMVSFNLQNTSMYNLSDIIFLTCKL